MLGSINIVAFVPTKDTEKARAFYEGVLGLRFVKDDGFSMVMDANGIMVRVAKAQFTPAPFTILGWQVPDIERVAGVVPREDLVRHVQNSDAAARLPLEQAASVFLKLWIMLVPVVLPGAERRKIRMRLS